MIFVYGGLYDVFVEGCMVCGCMVSLWKVVGYAHAGLYDVFIEGCLVLVCCVYAALYRLCYIVFVWILYGQSFKF